MRDFFALNRLDPIEMLGNRPGLVRLDRTDEMPLETIGHRPPGRWRCPPVMTDRHLWQRFLQIALSEPALSLGRERQHRVGIEGFAHRKQIDCVGFATTGTSGLGDAAQ
jgi:hypothetical protein